VAIFGSSIAPYGANEQNLLEALLPPSKTHLFGTDTIGRDLFSRIVLGTRYSLLISLLSVLLGAAIGIPLGLIAGFSGGRTDSMLMGIVDILLTIPVIVLAIAIVTVVGPGLTGLVIAISTTFAPRLARLTRGRVLEVKEEVFVDAATALGARVPRLLMRHVLPNSFAPLIIEITLRAGQAVLVGAALGFLGLGVQPPTPEWGTMLSRGREYLEVAPYIVVVPGLAISFLVLGFNLFGDGLRDLWDPTQQG
jgi:ABC-type dipeptide/oligopeptide/nickel transport system permease subunit